jgi:hypothetical protein
MEYSKKIVDFIVYKDGKEVLRGKILSQFLGTLSNMYINMPNTPYHFEIIYDKKSFNIKSIF